MDTEVAAIDLISEPLWYFLGIYHEKPNKFEPQDCKRFFKHWVKGVKRPWALFLGLVQTIGPSAEGI